MSITGAIVLYSVIWFMTFYIVLQLRTRTQAEAGPVEPGTPASAPATEDVGKSARLATLWGTLIFAVIAGIILSGRVGIDDMNIFGLVPPGVEG